MPLNSTGACAAHQEHQDILNILHSRHFNLSEWDQLGQISKLPDELVEEYIAEIYQSIDFTAIKKAKLTVVADCCNGSASTMIRKVFEKCGLKLITLNDELRGYLPHDPEPRPRTAYQAKALLEALGADIALVFNSDATRVSFVTSSGEPLSEELTFPLLANSYLEKIEAPGAVVTNVCTTRSLDKVIEKHGCELIKTRVGLSAAVENMQEINALIAGDGMGSVAFNGKVPGFDAFRTSLLMLEAMASKGKTSAELVKEIPRYHIHKSKIACDNARAYGVLARIVEMFEEPLAIDETDGIRMEWKEGWTHIRVSETEPALRLITEWPSKEKTHEKAEQAKRIITRNLLHE
jgi:phosphomannomutase